MTAFLKMLNEKNFLPFFTLLFIGFLIYSNTLYGEFVSYGGIYTVENLAVRDIGDISRFGLLIN